MAAPLFEFHDDVVTVSRRDFYRRHAKRGFDVVAVLLMAPVVIPLLAVIFLLTMLDGAPPLYSQIRVGRAGQAFRCWKVRTMVPDADERLTRILASDPMAAAEWRLRQKLSHDPRITSVGRVLRKTSLDELPQLWNVLTGSMSLVGPRPFTPEQLNLYCCGHAGVGYFRVRPGITGPWQVGRRNLGTFAERAGYDAEYVNKMNFGTDAAILLRTVGVVLRATGA